MNFSESVKKEIISKPPKLLHCKKAFLSGIIRGTGVLYEKDGKFGIEFKVFDEETASLVIQLIKSLFDYDVREVSVKNDHLNKRDVTVINIFSDNAIDVLIGLEILIKNGEDILVNYDYYGSLTVNECCFKSFMRGLFISSGNCIVPNDNKAFGYRLELSFSHSKTISQTAERLLEYDIEALVSRRRDSYILYIKSAEKIKDFLAFLSTPVSVIKLSDIIVQREFKNRVNRQKNCDLKNVDRQVEASSKQIDAINIIEKRFGLDNLKTDLREVAIARRNNPEETLTELANRLDITKSCLNHRLRKLVEIAREI